MDAWDIINSRLRAQLTDNSDHFQALSKASDNIEYPKDFKPTNIQKYNGKQDPAQWLRLYSTAISVVGGDTNTKVLYILMTQEPTPLTWLESLARESIYSWEDLKKAFVDNFQGSLQMRTSLLWIYKRFLRWTFKPFKVQSQELARDN